MKHVNRFLLVLWSVSIFIIVLWLSLVPMINNSHFFQKIWQEENIYEKIDMSEEELTKVIDHTMDYMWGKEDSLQIEVTLTTGETVNFYQNWGIDKPTGLEMDELGHMADCKKLFMGGKYLATGALIVFIISTGLLIWFRKDLNPKMLRITYYTYGAILAIVAIFGVACLIDFDAMFIGFHNIFFSDTKYSYLFPWYSRMIIMLPEDAIFECIVRNTLIHFFSYFALIISGTIVLQKKAFKKPLQNSNNQLA